MAAYVAVVSLKRIIVRLINYYDTFFPPPVLQILKFADRELKSFLQFLGRLDSRSRKRMSASLARIPEATSKFKDVFQSNLEKLADDQSAENINGDLLEYLKQDTDSFIETLKKMEEEYYQPEDDEVDSGGSRSKMVGLSDVYNELKEDLVGTWVEKHVSSLVGMAGIGKTTLAKEIFEDFDIVEWFDCRARVAVGREFKSEEISQAILAQVLDPDAHQMVTGESYEEYLGRCLEGKRYLVLLDDVWGREVQFYLERSFPDNQNGSRILITTTKQFLAENFLFSCNLIKMRLLNEEESWNLLCDKVFGGDKCPPQYEKAGKKIANKCDGLPLTIITVADLILKAAKKTTLESLWIEMATQKKHQLFTDAYDEISKVLYPIYERLSEYLKSGFLYMGVFRQNYEIPKSKLFNLWIVGKLVETGFHQNLDEFLEELTAHSLVVVYQRSTTYIPLTLTERIKTCALHSSWWHFCQREARKNNFFHVLNCYEDGLGEGIKGQSWLSIHNNVLFSIEDVYNSMEENCASTAHTLLCFGPYHKYQVPICFGLMLLRKLDALEIRFYEFPLEVLELDKLRYLALTCNGELPSSISKLGKLQFLIVHKHVSIIKSSRVVSNLPKEIWDLKKLKHLQVVGSDLPNTGDTLLQNLLTLSDVSFDSCTKDVVGRIPNLKKLGIRVQLTPDTTNPLCCFDLNKLISLKCVVVNPQGKSEAVPPPAHIFPSHLRKLSLSGLGYPWEEMRNIASLPNLQVLKLRCNAFQGPKWEIEENGFQGLYSLVIEDIDLVQLEGARASFKCLRKLSIKHCYKLKELHLRHCDLISKIDIVDCNPSIEKEIKQIIAESPKFPDHFLIQSSWKS